MAAKTITLAAALSLAFAAPASARTLTETAANPCIHGTPSGEASVCACLRFRARDGDGH
jgi:hypothetical protein